MNKDKSMGNRTARKRLGKPLTIRVTAEHDIAGARQASRTLAESLGLSRVNIFFVATSVSELANNLFFHATAGGTITLAGVRQKGNIGIEVIVEDDGPGISDVRLAIEDGFSTNGGLGGGLPGVKRLMDEFEIVSEVGKGTRIVARKWEPCK